MVVAAVVPGNSAERCVHSMLRASRGGGLLAGSANQGLKKAMREGWAERVNWAELRLVREGLLAAPAASPNMRLRGMQRYNGVQLRNAASGTNGDRHQSGSAV